MLICWPNECKRFAEQHKISSIFIFFLLLGMKGNQIARRLHLFMNFKWIELIHSLHFLFSIFFRSPNFFISFSISQQMNWYTKITKLYCKRFIKILAIIFSVWVFLFFLCAEFDLTQSTANIQLRSFCGNFMKRNIFYGK